jgi:hypothetical protein
MAIVMTDTTTSFAQLKKRSLFGRTPWQVKVKVKVKDENKAEETLPFKRAA